GRTPKLHLAALLFQNVSIGMPEASQQEVETDATSGLSKIRMGGIASDLWTPTKNLSTRPVRNALREIETPDMASILPILEATPSPGSSAKPAASARPSPTATPRR